MNSPSSRRRRQVNRPLHPPLLGPELFEMLFPTFDRACSYGLRDIGVGRKIPYLIEIFASSWGFNYNRIHRKFFPGALLCLNRHSPDARGFEARIALLMGLGNGKSRPHERPLWVDERTRSRGRGARVAVSAL